MKKFEAVEEYLSRSDQIFELKSFLLFLSDDEALDQMNALSNSTITDKLKDFLKDYFPAPTHRETVGTCDAVMGGIMSRKKGLGSRRATVIDDVMRGLREKIDQLIACRIVPHRFEGFFSVKGKENILCTRNLVPGEALYGEKLICVQYEEDRTEVEYRVWDPLRSKLAAAIHFGVTNIWIDGLVYVVGFCDDDVAHSRQEAKCFDN
ncbi:hypothetical protein AgCh_019870 [Apium graveolens]